MGDDLDRTLAALADPTRRGIVELLREGPRNPSEIAEALDVSRPVMSRHLRVLRSAGMVSETIQSDDARVRMYQLHPGPFEQLTGWLDELDAFWSDQLQAFKAHAEAPRKKRTR
jgi:DNA-binding transcriptional ArsR family regulator